MKNKIITLEGVTYTDADFLKSLNEQHIQAMEHSRLLGQQHAHQDKPKTVHDHSALTDAIHSVYGTMISQNNEKQQLMLQQKQGSADMDTIKKKNQALQGNIEKLEAEKSTKNQLLTFRESKSPYLIFIIGLLICIFLQFGETYYIGNAFMLLGGSLITSFIIAFAVCLSVAIIAHFSPIFVKEHVPPKWIKVVAILFAVFVTSIFYATSYLRLVYIQRTSHTAHEISHNSFVLINALFFLGFCFVMSYMVYPSWRKIKLIRENIRKQREITLLDTQIKSLEVQIQKNNEELNNTLKLRMAIMAFAKSTEEKIVKFYQLSMDVYRQANAENREQIPECLSLPPKPLVLCYNEINI